jgi:hypothetical protein
MRAKLLKLVLPTSYTGRGKRWDFDRTLDFKVTRITPDCGALATYWTVSVEQEA